MLLNPFGFDLGKRLALQSIKANNSGLVSPFIQYMTPHDQMRIIGAMYERFKRLENNTKKNNFLTDDLKNEIEKKLKLYDYAHEIFNKCNVNNYKNLDVYSQLKTIYDCIKNLYEKCIKIIIIGGGPIGLMTAYKLDKHFKNMNILYKISIFEKRTTYTKNRILFINKNSFDSFFPDENFDEIKKFTCSLKHLPSEGMGECGNVYENNPDAVGYSISLKDYENYVRNILENNSSIEIFNDTIDLQTYNSTLLDESHMVFGCDDVNSLTRKYLSTLSNDFYFKNFTSPTYGITFSFSYNNKKYFGDLTNMYIPSKRKQNRFRAFRSHNYSYFACQIEEKEYNILRNILLNKAFFSGNNSFTSNLVCNGYTFYDTNNIIDNLIKLVDNYYDFNFSNGQTFDIVVFKINPQKLENFSYVEKDRQITLLGDSVFNANFFSGTGINTGFTLIDCIIDYIRNNFDDIVDRKFDIDSLDSCLKSKIDSSISRNISSQIDLQKLAQECNLNNNYNLENNKNLDNNLLSNNIISKCFEIV